MYVLTVNLYEYIRMCTYFTYSLCLAVWMSDLAYAINVRNHDEAIEVVGQLIEYTHTVGEIDLQLKCIGTNSDQYMRCGICVQSDLTEAVLYAMIVHQVERVCGVSAQGFPAYRDQGTGKQILEYGKLESKGSCSWIYLHIRITCSSMHSCT